MARAAAIAILALGGAALAEDPPPGGPPGGMPKGMPPFATFHTVSPVVGEKAPDFDLKTADGVAVKLSQAVKAGPVVFMFASFSCPPARMKTPQFDQLAARWKGKASVYIILRKEAHPKGRLDKELNAEADSIIAQDANKDGQIALAEFKGPRFVFDSYDLNHDGVIHSHEWLAVRRISQFEQVTEPASYEERVQRARDFRKEIPGTVPVLVDTMDNKTMSAYAGLPNSAFVVGKDGLVKFKATWAAAREIDPVLAQLTGTPAVATAKKAPDFTIVNAAMQSAKKNKRPLLLEFTALGCAACKTMDSTVLTDPGIKKALEKYEVAKIGVDRDEAWALFETLELGSTPAFVVIDAGGAIKRRVEGLKDARQFLTFLQAAK